MKRLLSAITLFFLVFNLYSQNDNNTKAFDSIYYHVAVNVASTNPTKALHIADSLHLNSNNDSQKLRSLMLIADLLEKQGKREQSIKNALEALAIAENNGDYQWQAKIFGFLSTQYRHLGLLDQGKIYLKKGIAVSANIEDQVLASQFRGMTYQEMAYYAWEEEKFNEAIENVELASLSFAVLPDGKFKEFLLGNNEEMYGRSYTGLKEYEQAKAHFYKSLHYLKGAGAENTQWGANSYQGLGNVYLEQSNLDSAGVYLKKALTISEKTDHISLKENVYKNMASYYREKKEMDSFAFYENKYNAIMQENISNAKQSLNTEFNRINGKRASTTPILIYLLLAVVLIGLISFYLYRKSNSRDRVIEVAIKEENGKSTPLVLPQKTEDDLLEKLNEFEASHDYLDKNISFSVLVAQLGTNAKYLSHLIKNNKNKDYNTYINELRIHYIINKLKTDPDYLNYKISYLAEESGFSSHSKFSANFKRVTNLSPSEFIDSLRD